MSHNMVELSDKGYSIRLTVKQQKEMEQAVENGDYASRSEYIRAMINAGESNIAALDPRTSDAGGSSSQTTHDKPEDAARSLSDSVLIEALEQGENNKQAIRDVLEKPVNEFESRLANQLDELADDESSPVESGRNPELQYWLDTDQ